MVITLQNAQQHIYMYDYVLIIEHGNQGYLDSQLHIMLDYINQIRNNGGLANSHDDFHAPSTTYIAEGMQTMRIAFVEAKMLNSPMHIAIPLYDYRPQMGLLYRPAAFRMPSLLSDMYDAVYFKTPAPIGPKDLMSLTKLYMNSAILIRILENKINYNQDTYFVTIITHGEFQSTEYMRSDIGGAIKCNDNSTNISAIIAEAEYARSILGYGS